MTATTRVATPADIPGLIAMMREFYGEADLGLDNGWASATFSALMADPSRSLVRIVSSGTQAAGYVVITLRFSMEFGGLDAFVDDLFVRPAFRRRGLGRDLLSAALEDCRHRGILALHVETSAGNGPAVGLYASVGLHDRGRLLLLTRRLTSRAEIPLTRGDA